MQVQHNTDLTPLHTFGLPARARYSAVLGDAAELPEIIRLPEFDRETVLWLGGGSNILFSKDYEGLVVAVRNKGIRELSRADGTVTVKAQAGENWHDFVQYAITRGWYGLENLSLIPGTVGAAPVQNIGAYGVEVKDLIHSVECFDLDTEQPVTLSNADCRFAYRESLFKQEGRGRYVITAVIFALKQQFSPKLGYGDLAATVAGKCGGREPTAQEVADAVCEIRRSKLPDPAVLGNAGSFFKNPVVDARQAAVLAAQYPQMPAYPQPDGTVKLAAGWLIDQCRLKGFQIGGAAVHERQALVLVNKNRASAADLAALSAHICRTVAERFQVELEPEPNWF
ncbi:UDP-N-acetylmuramate dehydrogenase [Neisseria sp.]|uniref:UDP-N-acetylmuramate dehydrogenase n=1 Tax=Neisseria sp. TaxID=192066 RepID=UPI0035A0298B